MTNQEHNALEQEIAERRRVEDILQHRTSELALINQATQLLTSTLDLTTVLETVLSGMHNLLNITATSFWLRLPQTGELVCQHAIGLGSDTVIGWRLAEGQGLAGRAAKTGETIIVPDTDQDQRHFKLVDEVSGIRFRSVLSLPLRTRNGIIGVLNLVDTEPNRLSQEELNLLEPIAAAGAIAIENARLYQAAQDDIAERKRMEETLRRQNEELDSFAHTVAHNLKNPISTVIGYTDYIIQDFAQLDEAEIRESAEIAKEAAYKASSIISELLLLARVRKSETQR
ncbi:MAG TPA: GAF domain-containing protein, partial [Anaerolineae bacterium]|nr:GAF domain-containing protein [Anaerolineae bacterium]